MWSIKVYRTLFEATVAVVVIVVVVFVVIFSKSKVEVCFNLGPLVLPTLVPWLYMTIQEYTGMYRTIQNYTGLYRTMQDYMGLYRTT